MATRRSIILLTGFGPFPGTPENLSARLVPELAQRAARRFRGHEVVSEILPTEWTRAPQRLSELYTKLHPKLALHFGVSERASGFVIETLAVNRCASTADAAGCLPHSDLIDEAGLETASTRLPAERIVARLSALGLPASLSTDAGHYLCNTIFYRALQQAVSDPAKPTIAGFVHIPTELAASASAENGVRPFDSEVALTGSLEIIRVCLGLPPTSSGADNLAGSA